MGSRSEINCTIRITIVVKRKSITFNGIFRFPLYFKMMVLKGDHVNWRAVLVLRNLSNVTYSLKIYHKIPQSKNTMVQIG